MQVIEENRLPLIFNFLLKITKNKKKIINREINESEKKDKHNSRISSQQIFSFFNLKNTRVIITTANFLEKIQIG